MIELLLDDDDTKAPLLTDSARDTYDPAESMTTQVDDTIAPPPPAVVRPESTDAPLATEQPAQPQTQLPEPQPEPEPVAANVSQPETAPAVTEEHDSSSAQPIDQSSSATVRPEPTLHERSEDSNLLGDDEPSEPKPIPKTSRQNTLTKSPGAVGSPKQRVAGGLPTRPGYR